MTNTEFEPVYIGSTLESDFKYEGKIFPLNFRYVDHPLSNEFQDPARWAEIAVNGKKVTVRVEAQIAEGQYEGFWLVSSFGRGDVFIVDPNYVELIEGIIAVPSQEVDGLQIGGEVEITVKKIR